jgi:hypothetical protein
MNKRAWATPTLTVLDSGLEATDETCVPAGSNCKMPATVEVGEAGFDDSLHSAS